MARRKPTAGARPVMRTDLLPSNMTATKEAQVRVVLAAFRRGALMLASEQWPLFYEAGRSPNRVCTIPISMGWHATPPGCQVRLKHQICCSLRQPDSALSQYNTI